LAVLTILVCSIKVKLWRKANISKRSAAPSVVKENSNNLYLSLQSGCPVEDGMVDARLVPCCHTPRTVPPGGVAEAAIPQPGRAGVGGRGWRGGGGRGRRRGPSWPAAGRRPCQWPAGEIANEDAPRRCSEHSGKVKKKTIIRNNENKPGRIYSLQA
jgi:hypothetical protein